MRKGMSVIIRSGVIIKLIIDTTLSSNVIAFKVQVFSTNWLLITLSDIL